MGEEAEARRQQLLRERAGRAAAPITAPLNRVQAAVRRGDTVRVDVVVRTKKVGHFFPGGTVDAYDTWLELKGVDDKGQTIFWSGMVEDGGKGPVEKGAHFYRSLQIDAHGNPINKRNAWATRAVVYVRLIPPGAADTVHFRMKIPPKSGRQDHASRAPVLPQICLVRTRNSHLRDSPIRHATTRRLRPTTTTGNFCSTLPAWRVSEDGERFRICRSWLLAQSKSRFMCSPPMLPHRKPVRQLRKEDWQRWNDYGIGLLLQGDLKAAQAAFEKVDRDRSAESRWMGQHRARRFAGRRCAARPDRA